MVFTKEWHEVLNSKSEARSSKWFDQLTTLSQVEGQIRITQCSNVQNKLNNTEKYLVLVI